mmetsp:Transcript_19400/g.77470  ORF Transcript_19400/g.77470 Transcript_19400/m.77470 type:complete len:148 (+) Transcript_19400:1372-1815(+)
MRFLKSTEEVLPIQCTRGVATPVCRWNQRSNTWPHRPKASFFFSCCEGIDLCWLGLRRSHIDALALDPTMAIPLSTRDRKILDRLLREQPQFAPEHIPELLRMWEGKFEIQSLFSMGYLFLSESYLPTCLLRGDYLTCGRNRSRVSM